MRVQLTVNGTAHSLDVAPRASLLDVLRDGLGLTGTKRSCDRGECGACTVLADGRPVYACLALACASAGVAIVTIEGLGRDPLHAVQHAFIEADASQCGFCTPGQILSAAALLAQHPDPSEDHVARAMSGNLCRCGTYPKIRAAIRLAAQRLRGGARARRGGLR